MNTHIKYSKESIGQDVEIMNAIEVAETGLKIGQYYTIEDYMRAAITYSDNLSYYILTNYLDHMTPEKIHRFDRTFQELGIIDPRSSEDEVISTHGYASLFRMLYNISYLDTEASEKLLSWLASSTYDKGLAAGIPKDVPVANKFGERGLQNGSKQLHDCGIIYYPQNPYILCVMTNGRDWGPLVNLIKDISSMVYEEVDKKSN